MSAKPPPLIWATVAAAPASGWVARSLGVGAVALALLSALVTFVVLGGLTSIAPTDGVVRTLLAANGVTVFILVLVIGREVWGVVQARRRGRAAARLHVRIVALFSIIAAVPAVLVAVVASVTLDRGLDRLFSQQMQSLIENSVIVADAYVREQRQFVRGDSIAIAIDSRAPSPCSISRASSSTSSSRSRPRSAGCRRSCCSIRTST